MTETLIETVTRLTARPGDEITFPTPVPGLTLLRSNQERKPSLGVYRPSLCVVLQGRKQTWFGTRLFDYGPNDAVLVGVAAPGIGRVVAAQPNEPYLGLAVELDLATLREVMEEVPPTEPELEQGAGIFRVTLTPPIADCLRRLVQLTDTPNAIPVVSPAIMRELAYWLLSGDEAATIRHLARQSGAHRSILEAITTLRTRFAEPVGVRELAKAANMSPSTFHQRFKELTSTTPIQYQKQIRLFEAKRILLVENETVESVAFRVGYESPSQFSREYARTFGRPPKQDVRHGAPLMSPTPGTPVFPAPGGLHP